MQGTAMGPASNLTRACSGSVFGTFVWRRSRSDAFTEKEIPKILNEDGGTNHHLTPRVQLCNQAGEAFHFIGSCLTQFLKVRVKGLGSRVELGEQYTNDLPRARLDQWTSRVPGVDGATDHPLRILGAGAVTPARWPNVRSGTPDAEGDPPNGNPHIETGAPILRLDGARTSNPPCPTKVLSE